MTELQSVTVTRHFAINTKKLFDLLSTPEHMQQWFHPSPEIRMEVQHQAFEVGGNYKFFYHIPTGETHTVVGEYCAIDPPKLLAFTWGWEEPDEHAGLRTLVTLSLSEKAKGTELTVLHEHLPVGDVHDRHEAGWMGTLDNLARFIGTLEGTINV